MATFKYTTNKSNKVRTVDAGNYEDAAVAAMFALGYRAAIVVQFSSDTVVNEVVYAIRHKSNGTVYEYIRFQ